METLIAAHSTSRVTQDLAHLAWSQTHMHGSRRDITGDASRILGHLMHRLRREGEVRAA